MGQPVDTPAHPPFEIRSIQADGKAVSLDAGGSLVLPASVQELAVVFAPSPLASNVPVRFRWKLDGLQEGWQDIKSVDMRMVLRFSDEHSRELLGETSFPVSGQTPEWTARFRDCGFVRRRETVVVPEGATRLWMVISSAGPPETIGAYVVRDLFLSQPKISTERTRLIPRLSRSLLEAPLGHNTPPSGWIREGLHVSDAHIIPYGDEGEIALAIVDDNIDGHADWAMSYADAWPTVPGETLVVEWQEAYSISRGDFMPASVSGLPSGLYQFRMGGFTVMGVETGVETSVPVSVPVAVWATPWFWTMVLMVGVGFVLAGWRFSEWRRIARKFKLMERDRAVEQERVRIARDIHDDLGARVTQISLLSSAAQKKKDLSEDARREFEQVSQLSRNMVMALYETVWAVDPENDHLDSLGAYICQMATQMCAQADLKCRLTVPDLPSDIPLASGLRHDLILAVKEAVHNAIRHSGANELQIHLRFENGILTITISDNGCGFDPSEQARGNGLSNMKRRMESCQGTCSLRSRSGGGTQIRLELSLAGG